MERTQNKSFAMQDQTQGREIVWPEVQRSVDSWQRCDDLKVADDAFRYSETEAVDLFLFVTVE